MADELDPRYYRECRFRFFGDEKAAMQLIPFARKLHAQVIRDKSTFDIDHLKRDYYDVNGTHIHLISRGRWGDLPDEEIHIHVPFGGGGQKDYHPYLWIGARIIEGGLPTTSKVVGGWPADFSAWPQPPTGSRIAYNYQVHPASWATSGAYLHLHIWEPGAEKAIADREGAAWGDLVGDRFPQIASAWFGQQGLYPYGPTNYNHLAAFSNFYPPADVGTYFAAPFACNALMWPDENGEPDGSINGYRLYGALTTTRHGLVSMGGHGAWDPKNGYNTADYNYMGDVWEASAWLNPYDKMKTWDTGIPVWTTIGILHGSPDVASGGVPVPGIAPYIIDKQVPAGSPGGGYLTGTYFDYPVAFQRNGVVLPGKYLAKLSVGKSDECYNYDDCKVEVEIRLGSEFLGVHFKHRFYVTIPAQDVTIKNETPFGFRSSTNAHPTQRLTFGPSTMPATMWQQGGFQIDVYNGTVSVDSYGGDNVTNVDGKAVGRVMPQTPYPFDPSWFYMPINCGQECISYPDPPELYFIAGLYFQSYVITQITLQAVCILKDNNGNQIGTWLQVISSGDLQHHLFVNPLQTTDNGKPNGSYFNAIIPLGTTVVSGILVRSSLSPDGPFSITSVVADY